MEGQYCVSHAQPGPKSLSQKPGTEGSDSPGQPFGGTCYLPGERAGDGVSQTKLTGNPLARSGLSRVQGSLRPISEAEPEQK